ncbi:MAG: hypothetical protein WC635_12665 [Bacteriovorax sp.]|jgi:dTMP kinase
MIEVITLIGADASGKDTQIEMLKKHFENLNKKVQVITIWDSLREFTTINDKKSLHEIVEIFLLKYEAHARSFFLLACLKNSMAKLDQKNDIILLNGFFHKYWASEMSYGVESSFWEKNISEFVISDKIFYLKTPLEHCLKRKSSWSKYEQGLAMYSDTQPSVDKIVFQQNLHSNLESIASRIDNLVVIDGSKPKDQVFKELVAQL